MALLSVLSAVTQAAFINSALDFGPLNFANNMLNGSSIFGAAGVSIVDGIKVTGVTLLPNGEISIRLRHIISAPGATLNESLPRSVTVTLVRTPMNLQDLTSMVAAGNNMANNNNNTGNPAANTIQQFSSPMGAANSNKFNPLSIEKYVV